MSELTPLRRKTLEHIAAINDGGNCSARCPHAEMIEDAEESIKDGQTEWRKDRFGHEGRWITDAGREALKAQPTKEPRQGGC